MNGLLSGRRISATTLAVLAAGAVAAAPAMAKTKTLYVSPRGSDKGACTTAAKPCRTIGYAVTKAAKHSTIRVARGTYKERVTVASDINVIGIGRPVINAQGLSNGFLITGARSQGARVSGFTVENANDEGILALQTTHVTIADNLVRDNDRGMFAKVQTGECAAVNQVPGDCGEGIHLMSTSNSTVRSNTSEANAGGILITDELGPAHDNLISHNTVIHNAYDCGITLAGHNTNAYSGGVVHKLLGGVYDNTVIDNTASDDGIKGLGGGILIAAGAPGSAAYDNTVQSNVADGDGLGGFTLHSHAPGQYLDGNRVIDNTFYDDGLAGNPGGKPGDVDFGVTRTAGIIIASAVTPLQRTVVRGNKLGKEYYGIWTKNVPTISKASNTFAKSVTVDLAQQ